MEDFVTVETYLSLAEAEPARLALEAAGIRAMATDEDMSSLLSSGFVGGIKLQVAAADADRAREVLAELDASHVETEDSDEDEDDDDDADEDGGISLKCAKCGAEIWFPAEERGEVGACPECGNNVEVPA